MNSPTLKVIEAIAADILTLSQNILATDNIALNPKTGKNTLNGSMLHKNMNVEIQNSGEDIVINLLFDNYIYYIENGRQPRSGKQPPIHALRDWAIARGISPDNSTLYLIARAIWRDGIRPRPILAKIEEEIDRRFEDQWNDPIHEALTQELSEYFN